MTKTFKLPLMALALVALMMAGTAHAGMASKITASSSFSGLSDHITTGGMTIIKSDSGNLLVLEADFSLDGAPDPKFGFGNDGEYVKATEFGKLANLKGHQVYKIPASVDISKYNEIYVWCAKVGIPLGVASLK